jgi:hypothetical protein
VGLWDKTINPLNAELNFICHLLTLLGAHHILHVSRIRVKLQILYFSEDFETCNLLLIHFFQHLVRAVEK